MSIFDYTAEDTIGSVFSVDTGTVIVSVSNLDALRKMQVNHLIVLRSSRAGQHLIGLINKIMRKAIVGMNEIKQADRVFGFIGLLASFAIIWLTAPLLQKRKTFSPILRSIEPSTRINILNQKKDSI